MTNGFYITIHNGLLLDGHRKRMGSAVWEFMWLIDKVTSINSQGLGIVLGGRPIKLEEISEGQGVTRITISENLHKLASLGYINIKTAPHGLIVTVNKAKKRFKENLKPGLNKRANQGTEKVKRNKTITIEHKEIYKESLEEIITYWNVSYKTRYKPVEGLLTNLEYWLKTYSVDEIKQAVGNIRHHDYWNDKMTPTVLFRQSSPAKGAVDYIGDLLNTKIPKSYVPELTGEQMQRLYAERMKAREDI